MRSHSIALFLTTLLSFAPLARAGVDPLDPRFKPYIDTNPNDYPSNIWITGSLAKVLQNAGSPGTDHWITTFTRRKMKSHSFQVHVQAENDSY